MAHQQTHTQGSSVSPLAMPPLAREQTSSSWWSDRIPGLRGVRMDLQEAAKPYMKLMYRWNASRLMDANYNKPISRETADIYSTYLLSEDVATGTKVEVLNSLAKKVKEEDNACDVVDSGVLPCVPELLDSGDAAVRVQTCVLLGKLAYEATLLNILGLNLCPRLVSLDDSEHIVVVRAAAYALSRVSRWPNGAQAVIDAKVLDYIATLLGPPEAQICEDACVDEEVVEGAAYALSRVSRWPNGAQAVIDAKVLDYIATLLGPPEAQICEDACVDENIGVVEGAVHALSQVSKWPGGAQAAVDAKVLDYIAELFQSQSALIFQWMCQLVGHLVSSESAAPAALATTPWTWLILCLHSESDLVRTNAAFALAQTSRHQDGVAALADTGILDDLDTLNQSLEPEFQVHASTVRKNLARHKEARGGPKESSAIASS
ncbi:armadillo-type protein [Mycena pura]|uniref:Armadillo-type protein n=1 Tax=Mycena pura TaxID=153505 RepID=A0AAD6VT05_9AGAR|nr:armadillo-type protein [Mycena pura]